MLTDDLLQTRFLKHLHDLIELSEKEIVRTRSHSEYHHLARLYRRFFLNTLAIYQQQYQGNLLAAFQKHQKAGRLELITCAATHGFLPLLSVSEASVRNQIGIGVNAYQKAFNEIPVGFWLPECAFYPGLEAYLQEVGVQYFLTDTHGLTHASQRPISGVYAPLDCGNKVAAFARDPESSRQVWSSHEGYPGDFDYREYYRDIGFELDMDYISPYILDGKIRINTGIKYHRVTGGDKAKEVYDPHQAYKKVQFHAEDFLNKKQQQIEHLSSEMDKKPIIVAPFDAELFGHWWFEGPLWLESVLRMAETDRFGVQTATCGDYLKHYSHHQVAVPSASTWGDQGYSNYWINETNDWIYPHLHKASRDMEKLAGDFEQVPAGSLMERALNQAARSLLLAQASDWPFIMKSGTTIEYAKKRVTDHLARFNYLQDSIRNNRIDERYLAALELMDNIFPDIDFKNYIAPDKRLSLV